MDQTDELQTEVENQTAAPAAVLFDDADELEAGGEGEGNQEPAGEVETPEGEEGQQPRESRTFQEIRKNLNGALKDKRRMERELEDLRAKLPKPEPTLGAKPTLDQYDYDETRFSEAYDKWMEQKAAMDAADRQKLDDQRKQQDEIENFKKSYKARSEALGVADFQESEAEVGAMLNQTQSGLLMRGADDPAALVYALSKSPARLIDLSRITDPVKFTVAVAKLEMNLTTRKTPRPAPEPRISSERSATGHSASGSQLEKLRDEAARTGDYSRVVAYKKQMGAK
ncbi:hypothetical protein [Paraburkholderia sp. BL9I2N2]|uniref:hypothetical protein n=1 Tax=Paraburkholderia sp. BL9I2N2 TaxID=1938809 RepID=UPI0010457A76|nr:hypothetical protein [Paraburkholderia sp. BL9I2N2]TCK87367.1 hypothetical protein B0G74_7906 [Paraburkholderia sp. BL9I2N2]